MATPVKVKIDASSGLLEVEGSEEFVKEMLDKYKDIIDKSVTPQKGAKTQESKPKKERKTPSRGANINDPLNKILEAGFLNDWKFVREVSEELKRIGTSNVTTENVTMSLKSKLGTEIEREKDTTEDMYHYRKIAK